MKLKFPKITFRRLIAVAFIASILTAILFYGFTSVHPLPEWASQHPTVAELLRFWPLGILPFLALITVGVTIAVEWGFAQWFSSSGIPAIQGPIHSNLGNDQYYELFQKPLTRAMESQHKTGRLS